jgi:hypothetical protein
VPGPGYWTENFPSLAVKRGFDSTGSPIGGRPQSGGQTYRGTTGVTRSDIATAAAAATATPAPNESSSRAWVVWRTGTAAYDPAGTAYPGRTVDTVGVCRVSLRRTRSPRRRAGGDTAVRAESHVGNHVVAVRAQHLLTRIHLVVRLMQQRGLQPNPQGQQGEYCDQHVQREMQALQDGVDLHQPQAGVEDGHRQHTPQKQSNGGAAAASRVRGPGEPQRRADQAAHRSRGQRHRDTLDARLEQ